MCVYIYIYYKCIVFKKANNYEYNLEEKSKVSFLFFFSIRKKILHNKFRAVMKKKFKRFFFEILYIYIYINYVSLSC
jgi:hypothetical protein